MKGQDLAVLNCTICERKFGKFCYLEYHFKEKPARLRNLNNRNNNNLTGCKGPLMEPQPTSEQILMFPTDNK